MSQTISTSPCRRTFCFGLSPSIDESLARHHIVIAVARDELAIRYPAIDRQLTAKAMQSLVSVASIWEISIKSRLGKLDPKAPLNRLGSLFESYGFEILDINRHHAVAFVEPEPTTRDPFDRMLLAQCKVEGLQLVTFDRALAGHPLAWPLPA